jgi:putative intracellular protease/amidase
MNQLTDTKVAILVENGFEQVELTGPKKALELEGFRVQKHGMKPIGELK